MHPRENPRYVYALGRSKRRVWISGVSVSVFKNIGYRFGISVYRHTTSLHGWLKSSEAKINAFRLSSCGLKTNPSLKL